jgi:hypothetical protein
MRNKRLNEIEDIGFYVTMCFVSIVIGLNILSLIIKIINHE